MENNKPLKDLVYDYICEALGLWRQRNPQEHYVDKKALVETTVELMEMDYLCNDLIQDDVEEIASELVWENEEEYFSV